MEALEGERGPRHQRLRLRWELSGVSSLLIELVAPIESASPRTPREMTDEQFARARVSQSFTTATI